MKSSFADESWSGNLWFRHMVLAHIFSNQDLDWFNQLLFCKSKKGLGSIEFKAHEAIKLLAEVDISIKNKIWQSLQDVIIIIIDPRYYLKMFGIEVFPNSVFKLKNEGNEISINRSNQSYSLLVELLQKYISEIILLDSPLSDIKFSIDEISSVFDVFPNTSFFSPENIMSLVQKNDYKKGILGAIELSLRFYSAFFELIDQGTKKSVGEELFQYGNDFLWIEPRYHLEILYKSISSNRFFDEGYTKSISIIKRCCENIKTGFKHPIFEYEFILPQVRIAELDSKENIRIQAADLAAGIARNIYENKGINILKEKFNYIVLNGEKI